MLRRSIWIPGDRRTAAHQRLRLSVACFAQHGNAGGRGHSSNGGRGAGSGPRRGRGGGRGAPKHASQPQQHSNDDENASDAWHVDHQQQQEQHASAAPRQQRSAPLPQQPAQRRTAPGQRGRPQQILAGARQSGIYNGNRSGSAPRGRARQWPQRVQRNVKKEDVISLREWLLDAAKNTRQGGAPPKVLVSVASSLRRVAAAELKEATTNDVTTHDGDASVPNVESALQKLHALVKSALHVQRLNLSVFVWAVSEGLEAHPALHAAATSRADFVATLERALAAAAQAKTTYDDAKHVSQVAVAQHQLGIICMPYWHELQRRRAIDLGAREVANIYHAYGKLCKLAHEQGQRSPASQALDSRLQELVISCVDEMAPQAVSISLWAAAALGHLAPGTLRDALLCALPRTAASMDAQNVANSLWALATAEVPITGDVHDALLTAAQREAPSAGSQAVSNILWALATAKVPIEGGLRAELLQAAQRVAPMANPQAVSNTLWALATAKVPIAGSLQEELLQAAQRVAPMAKPQEVSNVLWALATAKVPITDSLRDELLQAAQRSAADANAQNVSNTLWALATAKLPIEDGLRAELLQAAQRVAPMANPQAVSNTLWALATAKVPIAGSLQEELLQAAQRVAPMAKPQQVSNVLWALAAAKVPIAGSLRDELLQAAQRSAADANAQGVSNTLWALATAKVPITGSLRDELLQAVQRGAADANAQDVSNTLWALATAGIAGSQALHSALHTAACREASNMNEQEVANALWALARLQADHGQLCPDDLACQLFDRAAGIRPEFTRKGLLQVHAHPCEACMSLRQVRWTLHGLDVSLTGVSSDFCTSVQIGQAQRVLMTDTQQRAKHRALLQDAEAAWQRRLTTHAA